MALSDNERAVDGAVLRVMRRYSYEDGARRVMMSARRDGVVARKMIRCAPRSIHAMAL